MQSHLIDSIEAQKAQVFQQDHKVQLYGHCTIGNGILKFLKPHEENIIQKFEESTVKKTLFIPASGSGSRMFQFLYQFISQPNEDNRGQMELFLNNLVDLAMFELMPDDFKEQLSRYDLNLDQMVDFILGAEGLNLGNLPKGLIPFHKIGPFVLNAFQEHVLQALQLKNSSVHFTVNAKYREQIARSIEQALVLTGSKIAIQFSEQNSESDAFTFTLDGNLFLKDGVPFRRPSGHGALLENLNAIDADLIFIRNIDNVQHHQKAESGLNAMKLLGGISLWFQEELKQVKETLDLEAFKALNKQFQFLHSSEEEKVTNDNLMYYLNRPIRVCGMVRNAGQPGGGPFWIQSDYGVTKQIIEKAQISTEGNQYKILAQSTHFNPVMIAAITKDLDGKRVDLNAFSDPEQFFVVKKTQHGQDIVYRELPGLWNGSMAHWHTIFVEIPSTAFSPVKTVLDLIHPAHKEQG